MSSAVTIGAIAAISSAAIAAGSLAYGIASAPGSPSVQTPPPPPNSITTGADGEITSTQTFDAATNTWTTTSGAPEPKMPSADDKDYATKLEQYQADHAKWQAKKDEAAVEKQKVSDLRNKMLDNLNATPEDRQKAYNEYGQKYSDSAHSIIDPQFDKISRTADEQANTRGMFGSRAYVDTKNELTKDKMAQDTAIADQATMAKESLANNDRTYWANLLNQIDSGARADTLAASQVTKNTSDIASQNYAGTLGQYTAANNSILAKYQAEQAKSASYSNAGSNLAGGLMYLYGGKGGRNISYTKPDGEFI